MRVRHPSHTVGYRVEHDGRVVCFVPDNELKGPTGTDSEHAFWSRMVTFVQGADLLIHDAMYTEDEYVRRRGWGHSTFDQTLRLAEEAGVRRLLFTHHDPTRDDDALDQITDRMRERSAARGGPEVGSARESESYRVVHPGEGATPS
jgi:phosphoribosyl 1,2-cyclic phosphodiesterase